MTPRASTARVAENYANFQLSSLLHLTWTFDEFRVSSPELFIARNKDGVSNPDVDGLALRSAPLEAELELLIKSLEIAGGGESMYAQIKSSALEQLIIESPGDPSRKMI
ncbi:MAG: hypothetical protein ACI845_000274 [Gammaproteobacteria bacterium]|jgi:hypothetical protein